MGHFDCQWCEGTGLATLYRKGYEGSTTMIVEEVNRITGEVKSRRVPGRVTVHCRECQFGEDRWQQFGEDDRRKLWTTRHLMSGRMNYLLEHYQTEDPTYTETFTSLEEGIEYMLSLGNVAKTFPAIPKAPRKITAIDVANQLRERTAKEIAS